MSLNIKNEETHRLARELAQLTGETMTGAITVAIRDRLERERCQRFQELAERWEYETVFLSSTEQMARHPAHQEIVGMGEAAAPLILERMRSKGGHWFHALQDITGADPVDPSDYGNIAAMQESWLAWGERNGLV